MSDYAIRAQGIGKQYWKGIHRHGRLIDWLRRSDTNERFWALRDVSFDVSPGQVFGVIGRNGAGKSTLLKILARLTRPHEGRVEIRGRLAALLELGTGFDAELTGRENMFLKGALMGLRRADIAEKFDEIVEFSGLHDFLDTPVKRYSSGMTMRLGFSIAAHLENDILLVDEGLSVGDAAFRTKSINKMNEVIHTGRTVVFVGHNIPVLTSICERAIWLDQGMIRAEGPAPEIANRYMEATVSKKDEHATLGPRPSNEGPITVDHVRLIDGNNRDTAAFRTGQIAKIAIGYHLSDDRRVHDVVIGFTILNRSQHSVAVCQNSYVGQPFSSIPKAGEFICTFPKLALMPGQYKLNIKFQIGEANACLETNAADFAVLEGAFYSNGSLPPNGSSDSLLEYDWCVEEPTPQATVRNPTLVPRSTTS